MQQKSNSYKTVLNVLVVFFLFSMVIHGRCSKSGRKEMFVGFQAHLKDSTGYIRTSGGGGNFNIGIKDGDTLEINYFDPVNLKEKWVYSNSSWKRIEP